MMTSQSGYRMLSGSVPLARILYSAFTFLSCFLEVGLLVTPLAHGGAFSMVIFTLLAFHMANLTTYLWSANRTGVLIILVLGLLLIAIHPGATLGASLGTFCTKLSIQWLRNDLKSQTSIGERYKAIPRLFGFVIAFLYSPILFLCLGVAALIAVLLLQPPTSAYQWTWTWPSFSIRPIYLAMAMHSAHYFAFGYGVPVMFMSHYGTPISALGMVYVVGWLGYYVIDKVLQPRPRSVALGHVASAVAIIILVLTSNMWVGLTAWAATGFGGGTIFMLPMLRSSNPYDSRAMDVWDNSANVVGLLVFFWAGIQGNLLIAFVIASVLALLSAWSATKLQELPRAA